MKNLKKIAALVVVLAMALSSVAFAAFSDVDATSSYAEAINVMSALGIINGYEDGTFGPEKTITRAEFTTMLVNAMGMDNVSAVNTQFSDVTSNHWASGYISAGVAQGFINGYDATTFGPDDEVTYEQAVKMLICAVGYTPKFQIVKRLADGSTVRELDPSAYPSAYLAEANTAGVTAGVNQKVGDKASRQVVAKLVYNTLTTRMMEQTHFGSDPEWGIPDDYKTLLTDYLGVDKVEATVTAVTFDPTTAKKVKIQPTKIVEAYDYADYTTLLANNTYVLNSILALYDDTKVFPNDCKGYSCVMYLDNKADDNTVVAMFPKTGRNQVLSLDRIQFNNYIEKTDTAGGKLMYWKNNDNDSSALTAKLDDNFLVHVNRDTNDVDITSTKDDQGNSVPSAFETEYEKGKNSAYTALELIDNDNDGDYDIAFATVYSSFVAGTINTKSYKITVDADSTGFGGKKSVTLDPESEDTSFDIVDANGAAVAFEDIVAGDILNVFESEDNGYYYWKVVVTKDTVTGTVNAYDSTEDVYSIGGTYYKTAADGMIEIGDAGTFYVDAYGIILKSALDASSRTFGFVYNADIDTADFEEEAALVVLDQTGKYVTYYFAKNTKVNGKSYKKENLISKDLDEDGTEDSTKEDLILAVSGLKGQIVMYEVNGSGEITAVYDEANISKVQNNKYRVKGDYTNANYKASTQSIAGGFIDDETAMWAYKGTTPVTSSSTVAKTEFSVVYATAFADAEAYKIKAVVDATADNKIVAAMVIDMLALADPESPVMYVTGVGQSKTEDGDNATTVTGMVNGEEVSFMVTDDTDVCRTDKDATANVVIGKGDVIQYTGAEVASGVTVILKATDIFDVESDKFKGVKAKIDISALEDEDKKISNYLGMTKAQGWLFGGQVAKMSGSIVTWDDFVDEGDEGDPSTSTPPTITKGATTRVSNTLYTMLIRGNGKVYATDSIDAGIVETAEDYIGTPDDYMFIYSYDGTMLAVVIVDPDNDTKF